MSSNDSLIKTHHAMTCTTAMTKYSLAYCPLTPGQSPEGTVYDGNGGEVNILKLPTAHNSLGSVGGSEMVEFGAKDNDVVKDLNTWVSSSGLNGEESDQQQQQEQQCVFRSVIPMNDTVDAQISSNERRQVKRRRRRNKDTSDGDVKFKTRVLQYPPCCVCGGRASGDHYGANTCEACKEFFRRYLLRERGAFQCKKGWNCQIAHTARVLCSGCRLKKCLKLGMAKEKCKLGRYSSEKRTEKIKTVLKLKETETCLPEAPCLNEQEKEYALLENTQHEAAQQDEIFARTLSMLDISDDDDLNTFSDNLVVDLIEAKNNMKPFDNDRCLSDEEIQTRMREYHDQYTLKTKLYGEMKPVSKEEFSKLYGEFGIDVDDRMNDLKLASNHMEQDVKRYCCFAKRIPYFSKLPCKDQSKLMKAGRVDFFTTLLSKGYNPDLKVFLHKFKTYHVDEMDRFYSKELIQKSLVQYEKCLKLGLNDAEQCLVMAMCLFFSDRCRLENPTLVDMIQLSLTQLLRRELEKTCRATATSRFAKIVDYLAGLRQVTNQYFKEYEDLCRDEIYVNECPLLVDLLFDS